MAVNQEFPTVNEDGSSSPRDTALVIRNLMDGKTNAKNDITLALNQTTTVITDFRLGPESAIDLMPLDANAAAENWWISAQGNDTATINHASNALTRTFRYSITG